MKKNVFSSYFPFIIFFLCSLYLFTLPGEAIPQIGFLDTIYFDKWVHFGIFFVLVFSAITPLVFKNISGSKLLSTAFIISIVAIAYGIVIEYIQKYYVKNRSFDIGDIVADSVGVVVAFFFCIKSIKKIGPDRNRGRNQN